MSLEEFLKTEGESIISWPKFDLAEDYLQNFSHLNAIEFAKFSTPQNEDVYSVNRMLSKLTQYASQFNKVYFAYKRDGKIYDVASAVSSFENENEIGLSDALDDWVMNKYQRGKDNEIVVLANPITKDSFAGYLVSDGKGSISAQILLDEKKLEDSDFVIDNLHEIEHISDKDYKGKDLPEDKIGRLFRHYSRFRGKFELIYGLARSTVSDNDGKPKAVKPSFFTIDYSPFVEENK